LQDFKRQNDAELECSATKRGRAVRDPPAAVPETLIADCSWRSAPQSSGSSVRTLYRAMQ
ncbi:MAG: hypothetical protein LC749_10380, partial [Actinobacteria bacterium]|nr:hypothetical protein [Actinomycetota bacterium]